MTKPEFLAIMAGIESGIGYGLPPPEKGAKNGPVDVYLRLFGSLPASIFQAAADLVLLTWPWPRFPAPEAIAKAVAAVQVPDIEISPAEAWRLAWGIACRHDPESSGPYVANGNTYASKFDYVTEGVPAIVVDAVCCYGIRLLCVGKEPVGLVQKKFMEIYEQIQASKKRVAMLPPAIRKGIEAAGPVRQIASKIGVME